MYPLKKIGTDLVFVTTLLVAIGLFFTTLVEFLPVVTPFGETTWRMFIAIALGLLCIYALAYNFFEPETSVRWTVITALPVVFFCVFPFLNDARREDINFGEFWCPKYQLYEVQALIFAATVIASALIYYVFRRRDS